MELWIRSQKNDNLRDGLFKVKEIEIGDYDGDMNCLVINNLYCVGIYNTKERALEVLGEIQYEINFIQKYGQDTPIARFVFQMPKE